MPSAVEVRTPISVPNVLALHLQRVRERIARACEAAGRPAREVTLVAVTKTVGVETAAELARLGQLDLGENRVDALERKALAFQERGLDVRWHLIGHLQRNKARRAVPFAHSVHSVDTLALLDSLERLCAETGRTLEAYLEVKLVETEARSGFAFDELPAAVDHAAKLRHLRLVGLMAMAAPDPRAQPGDLSSQGNARRQFARVRQCAERLPAELFARKRVELSMGMSSDLEAAIHEGAHLVRVGTALFEGLSATEAAA